MMGKHGEIIADLQEYRVGISVAVCISYCLVVHSMKLATMCLYMLQVCLLVNYRDNHGLLVWTKEHRLFQTSSKSTTPT